MVAPQRPGMVSRVPVHTGPEDVGSPEKIVPWIPEKLLRIQGKLFHPPGVDLHQPEIPASIMIHIHRQGASPALHLDDAPDHPGRDAPQSGDGADSRFKHRSLCYPEAGLSRCLSLYPPCPWDRRNLQILQKKGLNQQSACPPQPHQEHHHR